MKTIIVSLILVFAGTARAEQFGLGVILGNPTGFSANYLLSKNNSIDAALAYDLGDDEDLHIHVDYLWRFPNSLKAENVFFGWYTGVGAQLRTHEKDHGDHDKDDTDLGPRAVIGLNHDFQKVPIEVFGEISMTMYIIEETDLDLDFGIGGRYYF